MPAPLLMGIDVQLLTKGRAVFRVLRPTCRHKLRGPRSCRVLQLRLLLRSQRACHHLVHASIRPPARLSVTARSPSSSLKVFIGGLVQVLAGIWHGAHVRQREEIQSCLLFALYVRVNVCSAVLLFFVVRRQHQSHKHWLCDRLCAREACHFWVNKLSTYYNKVTVTTGAQYQLQV